MVIYVLKRGSKPFSSNQSESAGGGRADVMNKAEHALRAPGRNRALSALSVWK